MSDLKFTPMMEQYFDIKKNHENCLLFFRLGDFYELFFEDAITASRELEITLTGRDCGQEKRAPMCGVPYHSADSYIARLISKGYSVAICEQMESPSEAKKIVKREVVRIISPGTIIDNNMLDSGKNNYIMAIYESTAGFGISIADVSSGDFFAYSMKAENENKVLDEIAKYGPSEIVSNNNLIRVSILIENIFKLKIKVHNSWTFEYSNAKSKLLSHFGMLNLSGFGIDESDKLLVSAAGGLLDYLLYTQKNPLCHITRLKKLSREDYMLLDMSSRKNLELTETLNERRKQGSLLSVLDYTKTSMGARLLRKWIEQPLLGKAEIEDRLNAVEEYKNDVLLKEELKEILNTVLDIERIMGKIVYMTANARDLISLKNSITHFPAIKNIVGCFKTRLNIWLFESLDTLADIKLLIEGIIIEDSPFSIREGGFIKNGVNSELDKLREAKEKGTTWLMELEAREKEETGIKNLKVRYNKVFGYYIEITRSNIGNVPDRYIRRQTLSNCERYQTVELKEIEDAILGADERIAELEYDLFMDVREKIALEMKRVMQSAALVAQIDTLNSLGDAADKLDYVKPVLNTNGIIDIKNGRHPVVEQIKGISFVPNDTYFDNGEYRLGIVTGPNMAGKSTYMRQVALIVLMAQIGSFVPASEANIGIVDRIFTRVGASDDLATGQSTFMVEMSEVANILNNATQNSLLILDEIGRGTSTFDGLSIAWSVLEHIADKSKLGSKTIFATHYHELTELEGKVEGVKNYCITVKEQGDDVIFLRKIVRGGADNSYGIQVAKLAGVPSDIISRANEILKKLNDNDIAKLPAKDSVTDNVESESDETVYYGVKKGKPIESMQKIIINEIENIDFDELTPKLAFDLLYSIREKLKNL